MAEQLLSYALTTTSRVKDRLGMSESNNDTVIDRLINGATEFIEGETRRRFAETTYTDEVYSISDNGIRFLILRNAPVSSITRIQHRTGTKSSPSWTDFLSDNYFLEGDGESGVVQFFGDLPKGPNTVRATYTAGYKINFSNAGDNSTHTLPHDLSEFCERLVERMFRRINSEGKDQESFDGGSISWSRQLTAIDKEVIARYQRPTIFV